MTTTEQKLVAYAILYCLLLLPAFWDTVAEAANLLLRRFAEKRFSRKVRQFVRAAA